MTRNKIVIAVMAASFVAVLAATSDSFKDGLQDGAGAALATASPAPTPQIIYVTPAPTPQIIYVTPAPTAKPTPVPVPTFDWDFDYVYDLGDTVSFVSDGEDCETEVTIHKVAVWPSDNQFITPDKGNRFITVQATVAGTLGTCEDSEIGYIAFGIADDDGYVYDSEPAWRDPQMPYASDMNMKPGRSYKGWITFELPKTVTSGTASYGDSEWAWKL